MADYELAHWVNERRMEKYTDEEIKQYLLKYGYSEEVVDQALSFIDSHKKDEMKMGNPPFAGGIKIGTEHYDTYAVVSLVLLFFFPLMALPLGIISLYHLKHNPHLKGKVFAIIGVIGGIIPLLLIILYIILIVMGIAANGAAPATP